MNPAVHVNFQSVSPGAQRRPLNLCNPKVHLPCQVVLKVSMPHALNAKHVTVPQATVQDPAAIDPGAPPCLKAI